jgi:NAD(P)-dependent dehydrogenase (short-subunit alcohol dehydrogenase family)
MERQQERDLAGQVAIVTGASRGIGKRTALMLAERGVDIVVAARSVVPLQDPPLPGTIGQTVQEIEALGVRAVAVQTDLSKPEDLRRLVDVAVDTFGGVDLLVNNAAATDKYGFATKFLDISREDWLYEFDVNVHSVFTLMQLVAPIMQQRGGGRIINVTTGSAEAFREPEEKPELKGTFHNLAAGYFSSKRAMDRLGNMIAPQLAEMGIYVISMLPGFVESEIAAYRVANAGFPAEGIIPMEVPARMICYFAACEEPSEYAGRIFWAERELAALGLEAG